ncbi:hypothetical protein TIFTF001_026843 [Ficus carica]|uniref:KIB1-4 beta-propeller domain-containing protein n=1 Tax=Ficus carica TaxID=3494 RepID=A0AA88IU54_FICCA|nr:hypothetical protein TIFTF001_026843 [Ficus carica]
MYSSIFFSALSSVSLLPLLNFLPFDFSEKSHSSRDVCSNTEWDGGPKPPCLVLSEKLGCSSRPFFSLHNRHVFVLDLPATVGSVRESSSFLHNAKPAGSRKSVPQGPKAFCLHPNDQLMFTRSPGDIGEWAFVSNPKEFFFRSVAYFEHQQYALFDYGSLIRIDFNGSIAARAEFVGSHPMHEFVGYQPHHKKTGRAYLVSSQEDLFGVFRYSSKDIGLDWTVEFSVYKFDFESLEWEPVWCIGDKAFFVGNGNSWSISLAHTVNCNSNSIFYGDDMKGVLGLDNGIYDLETWQTESLMFGADVPRSQPHTTWITPSLTPSTFH